MRVDHSRLDALRRAWSTARATSLGLSHEIIAREMDRTRAAASLAGVKMQAEMFPGGDRQLPGETEADVSERRNQRLNALAEQRRRLREQLRHHPEELADALARLDQVNVEDFDRAIAEAEAAVDRLDAEIASLREEQGRWGSRAGLLRQSLDQAEAWLASHPEALVEEVEDAA